LNGRFDPEWGGIHGIPDGWKIRPPSDVKERMQELAKGFSLDEIEREATELLRPLKELREEILVELSPVHNIPGFAKEKELLAKLEDFKWGTERMRYVHDHMPTSVMTRDRRAAGIQVSAHLSYEAIAVEWGSQCQAAQEFLNLARRILRPLEILPAPQQTVGNASKVFIGHGRSLMWLKLRQFLTEKLGLVCDEFNEESPAGISTTDRLRAMMNDARFAFLVMTSEDIHADGTVHPRENVVHEAGLFQGRLGFGRAIILLEEGCEEFSNVHGLGQIRFPKGDISARFEEIRDVLKREQIIS